MPDARPLKIFLIAGEHSGDALGERLMPALIEETGGKVVFAGVGGHGMEHHGLTSLFPLSDVAVMGPLTILRRLPLLRRRVHEAVDAAVAFRPDVVVIIDSPEFTHRIARRIRRRAPEIPIVDYVSPSVWAWRPGRARKMRAYVDHVLALLPFEPDAHRRLGGPACTYVGHPLAERLGGLRALDGRPLADRLGLDPAKPVLVVLPGSRHSEIARLMAPFGDTLRALVAKAITPEVLVPVVPSMHAHVEADAKAWPVQPHIVEGEADRFMAFRLATAALAASGTVTLELAACGTPTVVAYKVDRLIAPFLRRILPRNTPSVVLANLVAGANIYPEFMQEDATGDRLAAAVAPLLSDTPERARQLTGLATIPARLAIDHGTPSTLAAEIVLAMARRETT